ncbi:adenine deaminase C-terminal domain-containing protein [Nitrospira sp. Kam-Ns4a]
MTSSTMSHDVTSTKNLTTSREVAAMVDRLKTRVCGMGGCLQEPFVQLSFLTLPVIPSLKITDRGLVDVDASRLVSPML